MRAEQLPNDPPIPLDEQTQSFKNIPDFVDVHAWGLWNTDTSVLVATSSVAFLRMEENKHVGELKIEVLPAYRRMGIARQLLALAAEAAQRENRTLFISDTNERIPAGEAFMNRLGGQRGLENHTNQLDLADLPQGLAEKWLAHAHDHAFDFEMGLWDRAYPQEYIDDIVELFNVMNSAPRGSLQIHDIHFTAEHLRQEERAQAARGTQRWTLYVREKSTGKFAGYTEVFWNPNRPQILNQGATGVFPHYRNKGLGRWLKAAMIDKVLHERTQVKYVRTGNADSNAPMLKINHELGFKPYISRCVWQIQVSQVFEYLKSHTLSATVSA
jgi:GNAT superfamily N-acetyltransferase